MAVNGIKTRTGTAPTAHSADSNKGSALTHDELDDNFFSLYGVTNGTVAASKAVIADASANVDFDTGTCKAINTPGKNLFINGAFDIWQRGTGTFTADGYTADRWRMNEDSGAMTVTQSTDCPTNMGGYSLKMAQATASKFAIIQQRLEALESVKLANQVLTLSGWVKSDGTSTCDLKADVKEAIAVDDFSTVGTAIETITLLASPTATWTYFSQQFSAITLANCTNGLQFNIFRNNDYAGASDTYLKNVKLELGSTATDFSTAGASIAEELAMCQRYYEKSYDISVAPGTASYIGVVADITSTTMTSLYSLSAKFSVNKRSTPTIVWYSPGTGLTGNIERNSGGGPADYSVSSTSYESESRTGYPVVASLASGNIVQAQWTADAEL